MSLVRLTPPADAAIVPETTPNPETLRFALDRTIAERGGRDFPRPEDAGASPLARRLFGLRGVAAIYVGRDFVTVTKAPGLEWNDALVEAIRSAIGEHVAGGEPAITGPLASQATPGGEIETRIQRILDEEIRPAVAMDGGDVVFLGFHDGVVELHLQGSCSGCPSSLYTLKLGIEQRLREELPEVEEVVAI